MADITPISPPPTLEVTAVDTAIPGKPLEVCAALTDKDSSFLKSIMAQEELFDIEIGDWAPAADIGPGAEQRIVTYVRPLSLPIGPKQANVQEVQWMKVKEAGGFVFEKKVTTNAPKGDSFFVLVQFCGVYNPENKATRLTSSFKFEIIQGKSLGMLKGAVQAGATSSTRSGTIMWAQALARHMAKEVPGGDAVVAAAAPAAPAAPGGAAGPAASGAEEVTLEVLVKMLCLFIVSLGFYFFGRGVNSFGRSLDNLADVLAAKV